MPKEEINLPISLWRRFSEQFRLATGLRVAAFNEEGSCVTCERADETTLCAVPLDGRDRCKAFYRKAVQQVFQGEDTLIFRCPGGFLVFGAPMRKGASPGKEALVLMGGTARPEEAPADLVATLAQNLGISAEEARRRAAELPILAPRRLAEMGRLAQLSLRSALQGNAVREDYAHRQAQVMTLFEVASDLCRSSSAHELQALALNTLGVLYDVPSAAILWKEAGGDTYRAQTAMGPMEKALLGLRLPADSGALEPLSTPSARPLRIDDLLALRRLGLPDGVERAVVFPLAGRADTLGLLLVLNAEVSTEDEHLIRGFTIQLSLAAENQRLQGEVAAKIGELKAVQALSRQFLSCLEPETLFQTILDEARKVTGAQKGSLMLAHDGDGELMVQAVSGINGKVVQKLRVKAGEGVAGRVLESGEPIVVGNVEVDPRFRRKNRPRYVTKSFVSLPITMDRRVIGVLNLSDKLSGEIFEEADLRILESLALQATIAIERSSYYQQSQELRKISITDSLTGLLNRRYFQERLAEEVDRASRHGHSLSLIMIDIDHFKAYNDANGHPAGDKALVLTGRALRGAIRAIDVVSRFGGEEFAVILPETSKPEAREIGERIRREVESLYFPGEESQPGGRLTISLGLAEFPVDARDLKSLIQKADEALYRAKDEGRNRIVTCVPAQAAPQREASWTRVL